MNFSITIIRTFITIMFFFFLFFKGVDNNTKALDAKTVPINIHIHTVKWIPLRQQLKHNKNSMSINKPQVI